MRHPSDFREFLKKSSLIVLSVRLSRRVLQPPLRLFRGIFSTLYELFSNRYQLISRHEATYFGDFIATTHYVFFCKIQNLLNHNKQLLKEFRNILKSQYLISIFHGEFIFALGLQRKLWNLKVNLLNVEYGMEY